MLSSPPPASTAAQGCMFTTGGGGAAPDWLDLCQFHPPDCDSEPAAWLRCSSSHHIHSSSTTVCACVLACVCSSFICLFLCVCSRHCDLLTMHAFTTSLCVVCCCVRVCPSCRKTITVRILDREEYNKQSSFHLLLESPRWMRSGTEQTGVTANHDAGNPQSTGPSPPH